MHSAPRRRFSDLSLDTLYLQDKVQETPSIHGGATFSPLSPLIKDHEAVQHAALKNESQYWPSRFGWFSRRKPYRGSQEQPRQSLTGWKLGTMMAACLTFTILVGNVILLGVFAAQIRREGYPKSVAPIRSGDCEAIKKIGIGIHLLINIIGTFLLGASNYCMQTISAPTREDVDRAHAKSSWLDIGVPSIKNLFHIKRRRLFVWLCLGASSIPLHLVYNSVFLVSTNNNLYQVWFADESFAHGGAYNTSYFNESVEYMVNPRVLQERLMNSNTFENLTNDECIKTYAKNLIEDRGDVILVMDRPDNCSSFSNPDPRITLSTGWENGTDCGDTSKTSLYGVMDYLAGFTPLDDPLVGNWFHWICSQHSKYGTKPDSEASMRVDYRPSALCSDGAWQKYLGAEPWTVYRGNVRYCLSEKIGTQCSLKVATNLLGVVVAFNFVKFVIIILMATSSLVNDNPLVTIGDAAASFIERPDDSTQGMCMLSSKNVKRKKQKKEFWKAPIVEYQPRRHRWAAAASITRWVVATFLTAVGLAAILFLLGYAANNLALRFDRGDLASMWSFGLGVINPYTVINGGWGGGGDSGDSAVAQMVLLTNLPQLLLSFLYMMLNGLITSMASASEWSKYAHGKHRSLRVSFPKKGQRSTFFLQLPYRYSVPIMVFSILMHWLISQSIFMVQIFEKYLYMFPNRQDMDPDKQNMAYTSRVNIITTAGYSPMGMILVCVVVFLVFLGACALGMRRLRDGIPLAGSCSLAISAACHAPRGTSTQLPLKWGAVPQSMGEEGVGHCSFSNEEVELPERGRLYA